MESEIKYEILKIGTIPDELYQICPYDDTFKLLGFKDFGFNYERTFTNGNELMTVSVADNGIQWVIMIGGVISDRRIIEPKEFSIIEDLTLVEILAILWREWNIIYGHITIPDNLYWGKVYYEHIQNLSLSRPKSPSIFIERDYFRFIINKIKKESITYDTNSIIELSLTDGQLSLCVDAKKYPIPVIYSQNYHNEVISILVIDFLEMIPSRFMRETVDLRMTKIGLSVDGNIIKASWDGPNLWQNDDYDDFLSNRLVRRSVWFGR